MEHRKTVITSGEETPLMLGSILMAEDNETNIMTVGDYLEYKGYQLQIARTGREALEKAPIIKPDIILMDLQMPEMSGVEVIRRLRKMPGLMRTPIIALTALAMEGDRERCLEAGATLYISKPVKLKSLVIEISLLIGKRKPDGRHDRSRSKPAHQQKTIDRRDLHAKVMMTGLKKG